jgi:hypothetical protein
LALNAVAHINTYCNHLLKEDPKNTKSQFMNTKIFKAAYNALDQFQLIAEVRSLNKECASLFSEPDEITKEFETYTVDRVKPYLTMSTHYGISRVLQGFEVVLLSVMVKSIIELGAISLDHDGCMVLFCASFKISPDEKRICLYI